MRRAQSTDHPCDRQTTVLVEEWMRKYWRPLVAIAMRFTGRSKTAEDLVAEAILTALSLANENREALESVKSPFAWLAGITKNIGLQATRKHRRRKELLARHLTEARHTIDPGTGSDWRVTAVLRTADEHASPQQIAIVRGTLLDGMSDAELAESLGVTKATVRWHRHKVVQTLQPLLRE